MPNNYVSLVPVLIPHKWTFAALHREREGRSVEESPCVSARQMGNRNFMLLL